ncbi:hypothetical protein N7520_011810 [Penicillium odoratum]|uniref:uncharacterized protein n=1 Tax=Penicillium odoratum TaxID=1167516 RepID=UPI00254755AB|nr:uncharacterized protein N7520_011810 [Penicillium odoratum]KAJ5746628.1 hypothetical protein N7520_011810 [Penicillium odoratum]
MDSADDIDDNLVVIPVDPILSDGMKETWPTSESPFKYALADDSKWKSLLARMWIEETGALEEGRTKAEMEADRAREAAEAQTKGKGRGRGKAKEITAQASKSTATGIKTTRSAAKATVENTGGNKDEPTPPSDLYDIFDDEGPDYWKIKIAMLKKSGSLEMGINHPLNMDWVSTHEWLSEYFVRLNLQASFIPRRGETVLWTHDLEGPLKWNPEVKCYMARKDNKWITPQWRAGIITQTPEEATSFLDIIKATKKTSISVSYWGFRVETLPDPLSDDKSLSLQYRYLPLQCIKPFSSYEKFLYGVPRESLHPSMEFAMTTMASWSLLSHTRFTGNWPNARIDSRGIFIGPELLAIKDAARLKPFGMRQEQMENSGAVLHSEYDPVDVIVIDEIWLNLEDCHDDPKDPLLATKCLPLIAGKVYTRDPNRLSRDIPFDKDPLQKMTFDETSAAFRQVGMSNYGDWYRVAGGRTCIVSPPMILGRCYEPEATLLHFGSKRLDYDLHGTLNGRRYSSEVDVRIPAEGGWFWGDNRAETLGLARVNGVDVGDAAEQRSDPERWQAILRILHLPYSDADIIKAGLPRGVGRPSARRKSELIKTSKLVSTGLGFQSRSGSSEAVEEVMDEDMMDLDSETELTAQELTAPVLFRGGTEETEGGDFDPRKG